MQLIFINPSARRCRSRVAALMEKFQKSVLRDTYNRIIWENLFKMEISGSQLKFTECKFLKLCAGIYIFNGYPSAA